jgi:predicted ATPase
MASGTCSTLRLYGRTSAKRPHNTQIAKTVLDRRKQIQISSSAIGVRTDAVRDRLSVHQVGVADLLNAARLIGRYPASVVLLGLVPGSIGLGVGRTRVVDAALEALISAILREVQTLGYELIPRPQECVGDRPIHALTRHFGM